MEELAHKNRIKVRQPRGRSGWCYNCDRATVRDGGKCPCCGHRQKAKRAKKVSPMPIV